MSIKHIINNVKMQVIDDNLDFYLHGMITDWEIEFITQGKTLAALDRYVVGLLRTKTRLRKLVKVK